MALPGYAIFFSTNTIRSRSWSDVWTDSLLTKTAIDKNTVKGLRC